MRSELPRDLAHASTWMPRRQTPVAAGHQIRSYVLDQNRVKDLRTAVESTPARVLDGHLDEFIEAALKLEFVLGTRRRRPLIDESSSRR